MKDLFELVQDSKSDSQSIEQILILFEPKIRGVLASTSNNNDRADLEQELKFKLINCIQDYEIKAVPGFFDYKAQIIAKG